jgi:diguanylate cyclase (GGDEF)-like protein
VKTRKTIAELECVADVLNKFGIGNDPDWLAVIFFVRNLLGHLSVYSDEKKLEIQKEVFNALSTKDFSGEQFEKVIAMLDMFIMQTIGAMELEEALAEEKRSAVQLLNEMNAVIASLQGSSERQGRKLDDFKEKTVGVIASGKERSLIVAKVRSIFKELITEFREESRELQDRARALEHTANFDPLLTTLHNRRSLDGYLKEVVEAQTEDSLPLSLIMIDVDFFKKVNDTYGHQTGDDLLKILARIVASHATQHQAFPARYGGEELVVVMNRVPRSIAALCAESIRAEVENYDFRARTEGKLSDEPIRFTISAGVAQWCPGWDVARLVGAADAALYAAKNTGRNKVVNHQPNDE